MSASQFLAPRPPTNLETLYNILGLLVARYCQEEVFTAARHISAREAKYSPMPAWLASALSEAYRAKRIEQLYSHQASTAELVRDRPGEIVV